MWNKEERDLCVPALTPVDKKRLRKNIKQYLRILLLVVMEMERQNSLLSVRCYLPVKVEIDFLYVEYAESN